MNRRLIDWDAASRIATWHSYDEVTDTATIATVQDVEPFLKKNRELAKSDDYMKAGIKRDHMHAATIPISVQYHWLTKYGVDTFNKDHMPKVVQLLNSAEWKYLKTIPGRI